MSARQGSLYGGIARKWLALAERRKAHLIDLLESGRWQSYVSGEELEDQLYELDLVCDRLAELAAIGLASEPAYDVSEPSPQSLPLDNVA